MLCLTACAFSPIIQEENKAHAIRHSIKYSDYYMGDNQNGLFQIDTYSYNISKYKALQSGLK